MSSNNNDGILQVNGMREIIPTEVIHLWTGGGEIDGHEFVYFGHLGQDTKNADKLAYCGLLNSVDIYSKDMDDPIAKLVPTEWAEEDGYKLCGHCMNYSTGKDSYPVSTWFVTKEEQKEQMASDEAEK